MTRALRDAVRPDSLWPEARRSLVARRILGFLQSPAFLRWCETADEEPARIAAAILLGAGLERETLAQAGTGNVTAR